MKARPAFLLALVALAACEPRATPPQEAAVRVASTSPAAPSGPAGMKWIPAGEFTMGTDDSRSMPNERPAHRVRIDGFWMDEHPVTNAEFRAFVEATGHVTTAERAPDWEELKKQLPPGTPKPRLISRALPDSILQA